VAERKKSRTKEPSFGEAVSEVERILERLESEEIDIDDLSAEVRRAVELLQLCRRKLTRTDEEVRGLVAELQADGAGAREAKGAGAREEAVAGHESDRGDQSEAADQSGLPPSAPQTAAADDDEENLPF
jgi:exodeoxyribonuclease VII small subunit